AANSNWTISSADSQYPAHYYEWIDSNGNSEIDPDDEHKLVVIRGAGTTYPGGPNRTDCAAKTTCTFNEELQNFANWFTYYHNRDLAAKGAAATTVADITGVRVGYATLNTTSQRYLVASMNVDTTSGNKRDLFQKFFSTIPSGATPLRDALNKTGLYYECKASNIMGTSAGSNCPILPASQGGMCQKNYTILMTDGFWSDTTNPNIPDNADGDNNTAYDGWPYADAYNYTLADIAMHYYERDLAPNLADRVPAGAGAKDNAPHQHMTTFTVAFGANGTLDPKKDDPTAEGFRWPSPGSYGDDGDPRKIDDLWHAAYNGRGAFYNAQDPIALQSGLVSAFNSVGEGRSSSAAVAFNTSRLDTGSMLYQASFNPSDNWSGSLVATELKIDGQLGATVWDAAPLLDAQDPSRRTILTWHDGNKTGVAFRTLSALDTRQQNDLKTAPNGSTDGFGQTRLDYLRGDRSKEGQSDDPTAPQLRKRSTALGDIVYSSPVFVGKSQSGYNVDASSVDEYSNLIRISNERPAVIYVGANDGMLHGFWAANGDGYSAGDEAIAYVPSMLSSTAAGEGLHYLTDPAYEHRYYVDLSPTVQDAYVGGAWRTILIGGYRAGGRGLFALDITSPQNFSEANASKTVLWEFTSNDSADLGYTFSKPTIALMENGKWAAIFGNGYNDTGSGQAKLFILYLDGGMDGSWSLSDYTVISTGAGSTTNRNGLSTPALVDSDGNGKVDRVYAGDLLGNLWAFDLSSNDQSKWHIAHTSNGTAAPLFTAKVGTTAQPITSKPIVARNPAEGTKNNNTPNIMVYFGTGQYLVNSDKSSVATQTFYGVWDNSTGAHNRSQLVQQTFTSASTATQRVSTDTAVDFKTQFGWYIDLPTPGERVVVDPKVRGDYVFFNTLIPAGTDDPCGGSGDGWLMALKLGNGGSPAKPVYDINNSGTVDEHDLLPSGKTPSGIKLEHIPAGSNFLSDVMYTPDDQGNIEIRHIDAGIDIDSGRLSWREVRN
ncbi:MAG: hypothetical protein LBV36_08470, partial [Chromatiales bacterium]|nr:hypothetical protein [Chromatiales bacterium]